MRHLLFQRAVLINPSPCRRLPTKRNNAWRISILRSAGTTTTDAANDGFLDQYRGGVLTAAMRDKIQYERNKVLQKINPRIYQQVYQEIWQAQEQNVSVDTLWAVGPSGKGLYRWTTTTHEDDASPLQKEDSREPGRLYQKVERESLGLVPPKTLMAIPQGFSLSAAPCLSTDERYMAYIQQQQQPMMQLDHDSSVIDSTINLVMVDTDTQQRHVWADKLPPNIVHVEIIGASKQRQPNDSYQVFLVEANPQDGRPHQVWRTIWSPEVPTLSTPELIWSVAHDPRLYLHVHRTKGGEYVALQAQSLESNQVFLLGGPQDSASSTSTWHSVVPTKSGRTHHVDVGDNGDVFVLVQDDEKGHCLVQTTVSQLPLDEDPFQMNDDYSVTEFEITEIDLYRHWLVLYEVSTVDASPRIRVEDRRTTRGQEWIVQVAQDQGMAQMYQPIHNAWYDATCFRFQVDTPVHPSIVYEYDFVSRRLQEITKSDSSSNNEFLAERISISSWDGTRVPLSIIRGREQDNNKNQIKPVILTAYGAYGQSVDLSYNPAWQPLLKRGYTVAFAHIRGGGELGSRWSAQGRRDKKPNGVQDYLACARALRDYFQDSHVRLIAKAFSAGGVAVASAVNREAGLFDEVILTNAFLDVFATMLNDKLALTEHEWDEYGNPLEDEGIASLIRSYCPVQTALGVRTFPPILLIGTLEDEAVPYWNSIVYMEGLRYNSDDTAGDVRLLLESGVRHDLGSKLLHISSVEVAFILSTKPNDNFDD